MTAVTANEPKSHVNLSSVLTEVRAKLRAAERAVWNCEKAMTNDFICLGALVNAYSNEVMDAKISAIPTRMYGPETTQTLIGAGLGNPSSVSHSDGRLLWQGDLS